MSTISTFPSPEPTAVSRDPPRQGRHFRRGDWVRVCSFERILGSLDTSGKLEGLPFQPEMLKSCGNVFRVYRRADGVLHDRLYCFGEMQSTVLLEGVRCDGSAHGDCSMECLLFWKEAWLEPATPTTDVARPASGVTANWPSDRMFPAVTSDGRFCCQATELIHITKPLPWWRPGQYLRALHNRELTFGQLLHELTLLTYNKLRRSCGRPPVGSFTGTQQKSARCVLNLQPGELVEVKSRGEIEATLGADGKNRGLGLAPEMAAYCGRRLRVASRVDQIIVEWSGELRRVPE